MRLIALVAAAHLLTASLAQAQLSIPGAGEDKFGLIEGGRTLSVTTADDGVSVNWTTAKYETEGNCDGHPERSEAMYRCLDSLTNAPWSYNLTAGITGEKGKGAIISKGLFKPGASFSAGGNYRKQGGIGAAGYLDFYGTFSASVKQLNVVSFPPSTAHASIDDDSEKKYGFAGGVNKFFNEHFAVGGAGTVARAWSSPGLQTPISLCETKSGLTDKGATITASDCVDGYTAPLADQWIGSVRVDTLYNFNRYGVSSKGDPVPVATFGVIASANVEFRTDTATTGNIAFGPVLHPKGIPRKALLALVFKMSDVTNATEKKKTFEERFGATLWFGIPLTGF